jgi:GNAT superfamily N-acetyltransferase
LSSASAGSDQTFLPAAAGVYRRASLSNAGGRDNLLAHPEHLILAPEGLAEGRTYVGEGDGSVAGFAAGAQIDGTMELEDLFVDPDCRRRGIATALVSRIVDIVRARGGQCLEVTANPHAQGFCSTAVTTGRRLIDEGTAGTETGQGTNGPGGGACAGADLEKVGGGEPWSSGCPGGRGRRQTWTDGVPGC